jgi:hypothetical protein
LSLKEKGDKAMKKFIATFVMMAMMAVMIPMLAGTASAQTYRKPSVYKKHRNLINIGIGTGAGALLGALIGGKKGAAIGALAGGGGAAVYSYKIKPKTNRYYRARRY